jgi:hypothetical protein
MEIYLEFGQQRVVYRIDLLRTMGDGLLGWYVQGVPQKGNR